MADICLDLILAAILAAISVFDLKRGIIPDLLLLPMLALAALRNVLGASWVLSLLGLIAGGGFMLLARLIGSRAAKTEALGWGDVKLMAASGAYLGLYGQGVALVIGTLLGGGVALVLLAFKKANRKDALPFGPPLCAGVAVAAFFGERIIAWYLGLFFL